MKQDLSLNGAPSFNSKDFPLACYYVDDAFWNAWTRHRPYHWHPQVEIVYILSGTVTFLIGEDSVHAQGGDILYVNSGLIHGPVERNGIYFSMVFDPDELLSTSEFTRKMLSSLNNDDRQIVSFLPREDNDLHREMEALVNRALYGIPNHEFYILSGLYSFFGHIIDKSYFKSTEQSHLPMVRQMPRMKTVLTYIEENYMYQISLDDMAAAANLHPKYFSKIFRSITNQSPSSYLNEFRIRQACDLLLDTDLPVIDIALQCGFNDSSYFVSVFKRYKHVTPLQYRHNAYQAENR